MARCEDCIHFGVCMELENFRDPLWFITTKDEFCCSSYLCADVAPRADTAREIFEEIDTMIFGTIIPNDCAIISIAKLAELKKKYTEAEK